MKYFPLVIILIPNLLLAQTTFEKGYLIKNDNHRIEALIKNDGKENNPIKVVWRSAENSPIVTFDIDSVKEFGIYGITRYMRATVDIDMSSDKNSQLDYDRRPSWEKKTLF
jgi:hypothetical protein